MLLTKYSPKQSLNKAYLKEKISRSTMDQFKANFAVFLNHTNANRNDEEHLKSQIAYFLRDTWFKESHHINPIGKNDLVIHTGKSTTDAVGVIIEVKSLTNKSEMLTLDKPNAKALHELVLYYLRQRVEENNNEIKYLIATNIDDWFIFDANEFDKKIYRNSAIKKLYELKKADNKDNPWFYDELKKLLDHNSDTKLDVAHFSIREFEEVLLNSSLKDDNKLIAIYKLLSPVHLLKLPFANDSNSLQPKFYAELLHLIGLTEIKEGSKKLIQRKKAGERNGGSLIENTISQLESHDKLSRIDKPSQYGETSEERLFNVALELVITWINRILFLKLLEAQLASYHKGDKSYRFLNKDKIKDFDDLDKLFFSVLAKQASERREEIQKLFAKVPYLNSTLFEPTELEHQTLFIYGLEDRVPLPAINSTVLKDASGKAFKGSLDTIDYLFAFLDAYDFSSEGAEEIQEDNKTLINASVLGLIFEKINGYKDGSFFTPGFITMYMCRETIRRAVVQKFNEAKGWDCKEYIDLYDKIDNTKEANIIINSLKICDPAVGSGHFLVSALNEIIAIKSELRILIDRDGRRLKEYQAEVVNDELIVTDDDGQLFEYNPNSKESQRVQEALFHEKQTIIENCLFGVDINPNSVKICRLRLWVELLKNAYYRAEEGVLETLPNIDINIKTGNSLISRFALDADLKSALKGTNWNINDYKIAVAAYKEVSDKEQKHQLVKLIDSIKSNFSTKFYTYSKENKDLNKLRGEQTNLLTTNIDLFGAKKGKKDLALEARRLESAIEKKEKKIEEIKNNRIYENAFEWRFEFPEVLNDEGEFVGFDVVIGNPPYIGVKHLERPVVEFLSSEYSKIHTGYNDILYYFLVRGIELLKSNGIQQFITSNYFFGNTNSQKLRTVLLPHLMNIVNFKELMIFSEASVHTAIVSLGKRNTLDYVNIVDGSQRSFNSHSLIPKIRFTEGWIVPSDSSSSVFSKIQDKTILLSEISIIEKGSTSGKNSIFTVSEDLAHKEQFEIKLLKKNIKNSNIQKFFIKPSSSLLIYIDNSTNIDDYPNVKNYLLRYKSILESRNEVKNGLYPWYRLERPRSHEVFSSVEKIVVPYRANYNRFAYDSQSHFNDGGDIRAIVLSDRSFSTKFILALLNSTLLNWYYGFIGKPKGAVREYFNEPLGKLPIKSASVAEQERFTEIVDQILKAKYEDVNSNTSFLEKEIDQLVYRLYNLTEEEINIVEGTV